MDKLEIVPYKWKAEHEDLEETNTEHDKVDGRPAKWRILDFFMNNMVLLFPNSLVKPVNILVDFTPGVDKGKIVLVHQVLEHKVHQAWDDTSVWSTMKKWLKNKKLRWSCTQIP